MTGFLFVLIGALNLWAAYGLEENYFSPVNGFIGGFCLTYGAIRMVMGDD